MSWTVQSVIFDKTFSASQALQWLTKHNHKPIKRGHRTKSGNLRYRIKKSDPKKRSFTVPFGKHIFVVMQTSKRKLRKKKK